MRGLSSHGGRRVLVYDADCGTCQRFKSFIKLLDRRRSLDFSSIEDAEAAGLLDPVTPDRRRRSFHLVKSGKVTSGAEAIPDLFEILPGKTMLQLPVRRLPPVAGFAHILYGSMARMHERGKCGAQNKAT